MAGETHSDADRVAAHHGARRSPWAWAALLCSLAIFCPVLTLLGPLLAIRAIVEIKSNPRRRGTGMALAAIAIGLLATFGWIAGGWWWHVNGRVAMLNGPEAALHAGFRGDLAAFKAAFHGPAASASDLEAIAFLTELTGRYGAFLDSSVNRDADPIDSASPRGSVLIPYTMVFERATLDAEAAFIVTDNGRLPLILKFGWLRVLDADQGDVVYPSSVAWNTVDHAPKKNDAH